MAQRNNKSGLKGLFRGIAVDGEHTSKSKGKLMLLGKFSDKNAAHAAYCKAAEHYFRRVRQISVSILRSKVVNLPHERQRTALREAESVNVFIDLDTNRILGMAPASIKAPAANGIRFKTELCTHAYEIERYLNRWREQVKFEAVIRTEKQAQRDSIFRNSLASQIRHAK